MLAFYRLARGAGHSIFASLAFALLAGRYQGPPYRVSNRCAITSRGLRTSTRRNAMIVSRALNQTETVPPIPWHCATATIRVGFSRAASVTPAVT
jgi:hypothetical protein